MEDEIGVVIVDDSSWWLERLESIVGETPGLSVVGSAATQLEALEVVTRLRPPITILDLSLSAGNGTGVLRALRRLRADTRVIVMTGSPNPRQRERCLGFGARYVFDKAFELDDLPGALRKLRDEVRETGSVAKGGA